MKQGGFSKKHQLLLIRVVTGSLSVYSKVHIISTLIANTNQHKPTERNNMSYFPDYRCEENLNLLNAEGRAYMNGFRHAI